jgi:hypothetical protein
VSLQVDDDRRVYIAAVYKEESKDFYEVAEISRKAIKYFSEELPGVPFPYPSLTVFNGSGGMEFPMIINDGSAQTQAGTVGVTSHEIAYQYFPFYVGINEEKYGWMDEGIATFLPFDFQEREGKYSPRKRNVTAFEKYSGIEMEFPPIIPSYQLRDYALRLASYVRPGLAYNFLQDILGRELFNKSLKEFIERWNGKHPIPYDFFFTFNETAGKDLSWYWKPWFFESGFPNLAIKDVQLSNNKLEISIEKKGIIPVPVHLIILCEDNSIVEIYENASIWKDKNSFSIEKEIKPNPISITLGTEIIPDVDRSNNIFIFSDSTR